jgi:integrase
LARQRYGGKDSQPLSSRTVGHAHRVLHRALARAAAIELVSRNVASFVKPPKVDQMDTVLPALKDHWLEQIAVLALSSGARRGELLALNWANVDLDAGTIKIERSLEQTKAGLRFKAPKTKNGRRVRYALTGGANKSFEWFLGKAGPSRTR